MQLFLNTIDQWLVKSMDMEPTEVCHTQIYKIFATDKKQVFF